MPFEQLVEKADHILLGFAEWMFQASYLLSWRGGRETAGLMGIADLDGNT